MRIPAATPRLALGIGLGAAGVAIITIVLVPFHSTVPRAVPALLFVMPVLVAAFFGGRVAYVVTTVLAVLAFASGFIPPVGTLRIHLSEDLAALVVLAAVALVLGELVVSAATTELGRREAEAARIVVLEAVDEQRAMFRADLERAIEGGLALEARIARDYGSLLHGIGRPIAPSVVVDMHGKKLTDPERISELERAVLFELSRLR